MNARPAAITPYLVFGEHRRSQLRERIAPRVDRWYRLWAPQRAEDGRPELLDEEAMPPDAGLRDGWCFTASQQNEPVLHALVRADFLRLLSGVGPGEGVYTSLGEGARTHLAATLTEEIVRALCMEMLRGTKSSATCTLERRDGHDVDVAALSAHGRSPIWMLTTPREPTRVALALILSPQLIDALLERPRLESAEPLARRRLVSREQQVPLRAILGTTTVSWRELTALRIGDVVVLEQSLGTLCALEVGASASLLEAQIGREGDALAVQVIGARGSSD